LSVNSDYDQLTWVGQLKLAFVRRSWKGLVRKAQEAENR